MAISKTNLAKFEKKVYHKFLKYQEKTVGPKNKPLYRYSAIVEMLSEDFDRSAKTIEKILRKY